MTTLEQIYKELSERFKDEPNKDLILGFTIGTIEKYKSSIAQEYLELVDKIRKQAEKP